MKDYVETFGALLSKYDVRDYVGVARAAVFPESFELKMGKIKSQGTVGSCCAHSMAEIIEYFNKKQEKTDVTMSVGYLYGNREEISYKGAGYYLRDMLKVAAKYGDAPYIFFPYNKEVPQIISIFQERDKSIDESAYLNRITSYYRLYTEDDIKYNLINNGPVMFAINWYAKYQIVNGKLIFTSDRSNGAHCMVIYGWNKDGWKFMNSWGESFGNKGCAILPYEHKIEEAWGVIDTNVNNSGINIVKPKPIPRPLVNGINLFMRLLGK